MIDSPADTNEILADLARALDPEFRHTIQGMTNPYGDGTAATTIAKVLAEVPLQEFLIKQATPASDEP